MRVLKIWEHGAAENFRCLMPRKQYLPWPRKVRSGHSVVTVYRNHYKGAWRYQLRYMQGGIVVREAYSDETDAISQAENKADELNAGENGALTLNPELAAIYRAALNACASVDKGVSLDAVCREWAEIKRRLGHVAPMTAVDEFHCLASRGRLGGEDHFLARCREFGVITVLATQSLSLLAGALRDSDKLHALAANCRTRVFGSNTDGVTNNLAAGFCGTSKGTPVQRARVWHESKAFRRAVSDSDGEERLLVEPHRFAELRTGQFYVATPSRGVYWLDLNFRLAKPTVKVLRPPAE